DVQPSPTTILPSSEVILQTPVPQDKWSREKNIELVNIISEPLAGITTKSRVRDSDAASAHECLYVNFLSEMEPKKLIKALEEEGWIIVMQEELNQFERNKVWNLVPKPHGCNQQEWIDYEETFALEAIISGGCEKFFFEWEKYQRRCMFKNLLGLKAVNFPIMFVSWIKLSMA
ncbi:hypothetical protein Tco_0172032, partial [Tanacetum coccineum]